MINEEKRSAIYTARWHATKIKQLNTDPKIESLTDDLIEVLSGILGEPIPIETLKPEPPREHVTDAPVAVRPAAKLLWYPKAHIPKGVTQSARGTYPKGYPEGLIIHFTSGRWKDGLKNAIDEVTSTPYFFSCMGTDGKIVQTNPLNEWGSHAGESAWVIDGKKVSSVSNRFAGLEINNPSRLELVNGKYYPWFDKKNAIPKEQINIVTKQDGNIQPGAYLPYTAIQVKELFDYCLWLKINNPEVFDLDLVRGHDEVSGIAGIGYNRKNDPGGCMPYNLDIFRARLHEAYNKLIK